MPKNVYSKEFKRDAVQYCEDHPELTHREIAETLGCSRGSLKTWLHQSRKENGLVATTPAGSDPESVEEEIIRLRKENEILRSEKKDLRADVTRLEEAQDILRRATKYFAAETNW